MHRRKPRLPSAGGLLRTNVNSPPSSESECAKIVQGPNAHFVSGRAVVGRSGLVVGKNKRSVARTRVLLVLTH